MAEEVAHSPTQAPTGPHMAQPAGRPPAYGERLKSVRATATSNGPNFNLDLLAGRFVLFCIYGSAESPLAQDALAKVAEAGPLFEAERRVLVAVSNDSRDAGQPVFQALAKTTLMVWDSDRKVISAWGLAQPDGQSVRACWVLTDPMFRVMGVWPLDRGAEAVEALAAQGLPPDHAGVPIHAPVIVVPRVFEPEFCRVLIDLYNSEGGTESGVTREKDGKTYVELAPGSKRRKDCLIEDENLRRACMQRIYHRLVPEIEKAFNFRATRMERYLVGCYEQESGGFFRAHRDNTTKGTAHRRFAVSIGLNDEEYEGGELMFREFGNRLYRPPRGGAVVFGCSLMHEVTTVTHGHRYAFLPFLYDDAAAKIREANNGFLDASVGNYRPEGSTVTTGADADGPSEKVVAAE